MANLNNVQIGSVILNMVENVPTYISGATLWNMVDNERLFAEQVTGDTIGASIGEAYQPAIISLTAAATLRMMEMQGADVSNIRVGDFSVSKGTGGPSLSTSQQLKEDGMMKLRAFGERTTVYKAWG